ncbi:MAG: amylosucrase [Anaerolineaceae bacterium]|nr:amylosucrase [Anaerolineaceae bacterium]
MLVGQSDWFEAQAQLTLARLLPRITPLLDPVAERDVFLERLDRYFPTIFRLLHSVYGAQYDFFYHLEQALTVAAQMYARRSPELKALDRQREANPTWFQHEQMVGGVYYVDRFAGNLQGIQEKIPYFVELGLTYLHLMPLFHSPAGKSDGGYAVSSYRETNPALGTMAELESLAAELRENGISLVLDFVFNHTSDEHEWARKALAGDPQYQNFYYMFDDRLLPDAYERNLREIFPQQAPGNFTYREDIHKWVWTTFNPFQWDLNYSNPDVFNAMLGEMLFLANQGVEVLRLDAVAFIWKQMGTTCENLPQVHALIRAFNALVRLAAPAMLFKSEAIVHPDNVASYIDWEECPISYNPTLMALLWESLATRDVRLLLTSMQKRFALPEQCAWVNYVRCHDDIGWTFADEDAAALGINGSDHRWFLNMFYTGSFAGSFANGIAFNYNPANRDMRITGTAASLAGLEQAIKMDNSQFIEHSLRRLLLIHSIILSAGGIPLIYLGDEIATLNDYSFMDDPAKADDSRWVHRPYFNWEKAAQRDDKTTNEGHLFQSLLHLIQIRKQTPEMADDQTVFFDPGSQHVLGYIRGGRVLILVNFSEYEQMLYRESLRPYWTIPEQVTDLVTGITYDLPDTLTLEPYTFVWLRAAD